MKHTNQLKNIMLGVSIAALVLSIGVYAYLHNKATSLVTETINARRLAGAADATRAQGKEILKLYQETTDERAKVSGYFVPVENAVTFIKSVEAIGDESGAAVTISSIRSAAPDDSSKDKIGIVTANVSVGGTWTEVMRALELFEALPFKNEIGRISMNSAGAADPKEPNVHRWQLSFEIQASTL